MQPSPGHFAIVEVEGKQVQLIIAGVATHRGAINEVFCMSPDGMWGRGFFIDQIIKVVPNPDAAKMVAEERAKSQLTYRYIKSESKIDTQCDWGC